VRVAILDSGINERESYIMRCLKLRGGDRRIFETRSWVGKETDWRDTNGHGTLVARFFLEVAPRAHLYIGKVCEGKDIPKEGYHGIVQAIDHAITEWDVDIISLSFGIDTSAGTDTGTDAETPTSARHRQPNTRARIVFAAACNGGPLERRAFPARMSGVICVNASDGHGQKANLLSPDPVAGEDNFITLGAYVRYPPSGATSSSLQYEYKSGTSFATPIAAGLAADLLEFAR
ncbi:peptidase S8/S53 domain-containing protein, partial [Lasiosphaeria miniovina]